MDTDLISIEDASQILGKTPQYVRSIVRKGILPADRIGKSWIINKSNLDDFINDYNEPMDDRRNRVILKKNQPIVLSFFSGAMGLDLGLEAEGLHAILASEIDEAARKTIIKNKPEIGLIGDINNYSAQDIREAANLSKDQAISLIVGGPPCQAFSTAGKREGFSDERGNVFLTFIDRIIELQPQFAVIENVRGLLSAPLDHRPHNRRGFGFPPLTPDQLKGGALEFILEKLRAAGYGVTFNLYNSANFGSPQKRERVVLVCAKDGTHMPYLTPTHAEGGTFGLPCWRTVREAFKGLEDIKHNHVNFPEKRLKYYRLLKDGQYWRHLPEELQKEALGASFYAGGGKTGFLRRLAWDLPSPTLVTHPAMPATDLAHPALDRPLSVQEYKRIQEFPDDWQVEGSLLDQYKQIGNAVPCGLGRAIGRLIKAQIKGQKTKEFANFPFSRYMYTSDRSWSGPNQCKVVQKQMKFDL
jgi:DNA (cytosine-5)-methyltransferase 1